MAKMRLELGAEIDIMSPDDMDGLMEKQRAIEDARERTRFAGMSWSKLPKLQGTASGGVLLLGQGANVAGPRDGYIWALRRIVISGLTSGSTPDIVNMYADTPQSDVLWQFNGNNFGYTFGKFEMTLLGGQTLIFQSVGTFAATGQITVSGEYIQVPTVMIGKLI